MVVNIEKLRREIRADQRRASLRARGDYRRIVWQAVAVAAGTIIGTSTILTLVYKFFGLLK